MIDVIMQKHIAIIMANGNKISGFATEMDDNFIKVIEQGNDILIVRISDVSYIKIFSSIQEKFIDSSVLDNDCESQSSEQEEMRETQTYVINRGFSIANAIPGMPTTSPKFERKT